MKIGIIDIGTNSIRLFIPNKKKLIDSKKFMRITRIGEDVNKNKYLLNKAMDRTIKGLKELKLICIDNNVDNIYALATSAVRDSSNKEIFISRVKDELDIDIQVLSGNEEASYGFLGALKGIDEYQGEYLIVDIGGGSTELIHVKNQLLSKMHSFDIGVVRLTEMFELSNPPEENEIEKMKAYIFKMVEKFLENIEVKLIGIGGTITTLSAIENKLEVYDRKSVHGSKINRQSIESIYKKFMKMTNDERKDIIGLDDLRADIIIAGIVILLEIMKITNEDEIVVSDYDNLEGYYFYRFSK